VSASIYIAWFKLNWWSHCRECHLESFFCLLHCVKHLYNKHCKICIWQKLGGSKAGKPLTLKSWGGLKPSSLMEVYAYVEYSYCTGQTAAWQWWTGTEISSEFSWVKWMYGFLIGYREHSISETIYIFIAICLFFIHLCTSICPCTVCCV